MPGLRYICKTIHFFFCLHIKPYGGCQTLELNIVCVVLHRVQSCKVGWLLYDIKKYTIHPSDIFKTTALFKFQSTIFWFQCTLQIVTRKPSWYQLKGVELTVFNTTLNISIRCVLLSIVKILGELRLVNYYIKKTLSTFL